MADFGRGGSGGFRTQGAVSGFAGHFPCGAGRGRAGTVMGARARVCARRDPGQPGAWPWGQGWGRFAAWARGAYGGGAGRSRPKGAPRVAAVRS